MDTNQAITFHGRRGWLSWPGLAAALLALAVAAGGPWLSELLEPPKPPIDEVAANLAGRIKDRIAAKLRGRTYEAPPPKALFRWSRWLPGLAVGLGVLGCGLGVVGFIRREDVRLSGSAVALGIGAVVFQYALLLAGAILFLLLIALIASAFSGGS